MVTVQFTNDRQQHLRLAAGGIITKTTLSYYEDWSGNYARFEFIAVDGRRIEHSQKCGSKQRFDEEFANMEVIYNAKNPQEFMNVYYFNHYSLAYRIVFFFGIYLFVLTFILLGTIKAVVETYKFLKADFETPG